MNRKLPIAAVLIVALTLMTVPVLGFTSPTEVEYKAHDTGAEFSNAKLLQNMKVQGDTVTLGEGTTTHLEDFDDDDINEWNVYYDDPNFFDESSTNEYEGSGALLWRASDQEWDNIALYKNFGTDGETGTMSMIGYIEVTDVDDGQKPHSSFRLVDSSTGAFYQLDLIEPGSGAFQMHSSQGGSGASANALTGRYGTYEEGGYIKIEILYDYSSNQLTGNIYLLGSDTPKWSKTVTTNAVPHPDQFGLGQASCGSGCDWANYDELTMKAGTPTSATYQSQAYNLDDPTKASVSLTEMTGGEATLIVEDGNGNTLGSKTVSSPGDYDISTDPSKQQGSQVHVRVEVEDTGTKGDIGFTMDREATHFVDDPPTATLDSPTGGETIYTNTPELTASVDDAQFGTAQGDSLTVEWYLDGSKVAEQSGITSASTVSYEPASLAEGEHKWNVRVVDKYGGTVQTSNATFTVDHKAPIVDNSSADPSGGEQTPYSSETLSIDVSDYDFAHDGDSLTVGWYVDGTLVHEDSGIGSNGTVSYTTAELSEGTHNWYVKVGDSWGDITTSQTFSYEISHVAPTVKNPSIDGTTHYETNTLAVDVDDGDFDADGDTLTVGFYVDGAKVNEQTISSAQRVSYDAGPYADGDHTWHVEVADSYGYKTVSNTWALNIQHDAPAIANPSIDGTTYYEDNTLAVDISDGDFPRDGDSLDVGIYVDGSRVKFTEITSNGTVSVDVGPYADGTYEWHVEAADDYGYLTVSDTYTLDVTHDKTEVGSPSIDGKTHYENNTLAVDVADRDFQFDGDTVDVGFYVNGGLMDTQTITSNQTVSYDAGPYADGNYEWHVEAVDDYGYKTVSPTWWLNITHAAPEPDTSVRAPGDGETVNYENVELTIGVDDGDFPRDGDTVDLVWYINGQAVETTTVIQNGTYSYTTSNLADDTYEWKVRFIDDYGYDVEVANQSFTVEHFPTKFDESTSSPTGTINSQQPTFSIDVTDRDFGIDGDEVQVGLYINETESEGEWLAGTDTLFQNRTASITPDQPISGDANYTWRAIDNHGHDVNSSKFFIDAPNSLYLHDAAVPHNQLNQTAAISVITGSNQTADLDTGSDGSIEFGDLPTGESYVFTVSADGYYQRGVYVEDLYSRNVIFLINGSQDVVTNTVEVEDMTGDFQDNPVVEIETVINTTRVKNMPDNGPEWVTVGGDRLGVTGTTSVTLRKGARYRFTVLSQDGDSRTLGFYTARQNGTISLDIGVIEYPAPEESGYTWTAYTNETDTGGSATFAYNDPTESTDNVTVTMKIRGTDTVIGTETRQAGTFGEAVFTFPVNNSTYQNEDIVVEWSAYRNGEMISGKRVVSGQDMSSDFPIANMWLKVIYGGLVILLAFMAGVYLGAPVTFITLGVGAGLAALVGIAPTGLGLAVALATVAVGATMARYRSQTAQPQ